MLKHDEFTGFAVAIAWPEAYCKRPGYWYDNFMNFLGVSKHHYYKVGHAAMILIHPKTQKCYYFDFGRYHAPFQYGRVRSESSDPGLTINTLATFSNDNKKITNFQEILTELQLNHECHGEGALHASYCQIDFDKAYNKALQLQQNSPIPYGPFKYKGSNCSRFVYTTILAGQPHWSIKFQLKYLKFFTPTPLDNVNALSNKTVIPKLLKTEAFHPTPIQDKQKLNTTLEEPTRNGKIPQNAQWLSGEGSGSWFSIDQKGNTYKIIRYSPEGDIECEGLFKIANGSKFDINKAFSIGHLSHCQKVTIRQNNNTVVLRPYND